MYESLSVDGERETLEEIQTRLDAAANALVPALRTGEKPTLAAIHATLTEFSACRILVILRLRKCKG